MKFTVIHLSLFTQNSNLHSLYISGSYQSVLIGNFIVCVFAGVLKSLCQNKKFTARNIERINSAIDNFGNTFTSFSSLVYDSCLYSLTDTTTNSAILELFESYRYFLFGIILCFISFQISLTAVDRVLNINRMYGKINKNKFNTQWNINWRILHSMCYVIIGVTNVYILFHGDFIKLTNCLMASILAYYFTVYVSDSSEFVCYITNIVSCLLVIADFIIFHSKNSINTSNFLANQMDIFILSFASCFSQFASTIIYPNEFFTKYKNRNRAVRFVIANLMISAWAILIFHLFM